MIDPSDDPSGDLRASLGAGLRWLGLGAAAFLVGCSASPAPIVHVTVVLPPNQAETPQRSNAGLGGAQQAMTQDEFRAWLKTPESIAVGAKALADIPEKEHPPGSGEWPEWGWRVINQDWPIGPPVEFFVQCLELSKTLIGNVWGPAPSGITGELKCQWERVEASQRDLSPRVP